ncbi:mpv17-like protein [Anoplophora glabripennis]|uniref:mpv17-like protein n=1 Tax=Anoplophora glabripennis TaxID=217634 RepID=UPI000873963C|nr:mpv17-like protein [Anoplophora glabripennis]
MNNLFQNFKRILDKYPIIVNSVVYGSLCVGAEFSQQTITKKLLDDPPKPYDWNTLGRYTIYGTTLAGPMLTVWYRFLDKKFVGTTTKVIVKKLLIDQFFFTPQLLLVFYVSMSVMERKPDIFEEFRQKIGNTFKTSCMFWLPAQSINFLLIPPAFRVTYVGTCSFAWVNILCWIKRQS